MNTGGPGQSSQPTDTPRPKRVSDTLLEAATLRAAGRRVGRENRKSGQIQVCEEAEPAKGWRQQFRVVKAFAAEEESRGFSLARGSAGDGQSALSIAVPRFAVCRTADVVFGGKEEQAARVCADW